MSEEEKSFTVKDRRHFTETGEARKEEDSREEVAGAEDPRPSPAREQARTETPGTSPEGKSRSAPLPTITFSTFIFSLSTSAMVHLGEIPDPATRDTNPDLPLAKQTIDLLGMLQEKTRGNLDDDEKNLLSSLLMDLRLKYVSKVKK